MDIRLQAVTGVIPPEAGEARIRERYPSVQRLPGLAGLGILLTRTIVLAPLAWVLMGAAFFAKLGIPVPFWMRRYTLTNRRLMIRTGWGGKVAQEVPLEKIDRVEVVPDGNSDFFRAATIQIYTGDKVSLELRGVPEPESFKHSILNARNAFAPGMVKKLPFISASATK